MSSDDTNNNANPGLVWLVGAGPGDPGLITVKGLRCIAEADVIIYDSLVNPALLEEARPDCELLHAGKRAGHHSMPQEEINRLIATKALEGKRVCRLKGGDPFVFGRGGEEALHLRAKGIRFEIVPGVTSAVAVPAYAGIPVTHRGAAVSFRVITGHEAPGKLESDLNWDEIAATDGTLVFLMGVRNLPLICERLMAGGRSGNTPAALIANGTGPRQRTVQATLADIVEKSREADIKPPAIAVVGKVAALHSELAWFEQRPLFGRRIIVTRARAQASGFADALEDLGAEVIQTPTIRIESLADTAAMRAAVREAHKADWCVFTSVNGVDAFMEALALESLDVRVLAGVRLAAIGPPTAERLRNAGLRTDLIPERYVAEGLLDALDGQGGVDGQRFLLPRSEIARPLLAEGLRERRGLVDEVPAYRTHSEGALPSGVVKELAQEAVDLVTFTSSSTVRNFVEALPSEERDELLARVRGASIGPITSETMREAGIVVAVAASESTIPGLVKAIVDYFHNASETS
jgi:uroporphyrinogen III methyltransferase/synthase